MKRIKDGYKRWWVIGSHVTNQQRDDCSGKENIIPVCTERNWHWGNEVAVFVLGRIGKNSAEVLHSVWDFKVHMDT